MNSHRLSPSEEMKNIIDLFGGPGRVAMILKIHRSNVYKWKYQLPAEHALTLFEYAKRNNLPITLDDLRPDVFKKKKANAVPTIEDCRVRPQPRMES